MDMPSSPLNFKSTFDLRVFETNQLVWFEPRSSATSLEGAKPSLELSEKTISVEQLFIYIKANGCSRTLSNLNNTMTSFNSILTFEC